MPRKIFSWDKLVTCAPTWNSSDAIRWSYLEYLRTSTALRLNELSRPPVFHVSPSRCCTLVHDGQPMQETQPFRSSTDKEFSIPSWFRLTGASTAKTPIGVHSRGRRLCHIHTRQEDSLPRSLDLCHNVFHLHIPNILAI